MTDPDARRLRPRLQEIAPDAGPPAPSPQDAPDVGVDAAAAAPRPGVGGGGFWLRAALWTAGPLVLIGLGFELWALIEAATALAPWVGWAVAGLAALLAAALSALALRELAALGRIRRVGDLRAAIAAAHAMAAPEDQARAAAASLQRLEALYAGRADLAWARAEAAARGAEAGDPLGRLLAAERALLAPLDQAAQDEVGRAARQVAAATTLMPSALLDGLAALALNLRMIRRIAEIYSGRAGALGAVGLARRVVAHAMAAGLIALGDDLLEPLMGGGVAARVSRRLGEGVVNGALTARIGLAAMEVCRPAPFVGLPRPKLRSLLAKALTTRGSAS